MKNARLFARLRRRIGLGAAGCWRRCLAGVTVVGITGSSGKTTTKNLVCAVLGGAAQGASNRESQNGAGEAMRTLFRTRRRHRYVVQEVGACGPNTIRDIVAALQPDIGVVLNVGFDHFSAFHGPDAVAAEKGFLVEALASGGWAVLNADDARTRAMADRTRARVLTFGTRADADVRAVAWSAAWPDRLRLTIGHDGRSVDVATQLVGEVWIPAVLAAVAVGAAAGLSLEEIAARLARVAPAVGRMSPHVMADGVTFLRDDWKSPAWSLPGLYRFLATARATRRVVVLGTLSDDPTRPRRLYARVARAARAVAEQVILIGEWAEHGLRARTAPDDASILAFADARGAHEHLLASLRPGDLVVLRGSGEADHLERLLLARMAPIACWRHRCGISDGCEVCPELRRGM